MSLNREVTVFDSSGDVFLLLQTNDDQFDRKQLPDSGHGNINPPADETRTDEATAAEAAVEEAPADSIVLQAHLDSEFSDSKVAKTPATLTQEIVMQVSSKHLSLASKVFDHMFHGQPQDDVNSQDREPATIPLLKDNFESLQTLLYIVHGLTRRVSRRVERSQLVHIVILIDKYEFHEVAEVFTDIWFESLRHTIPRNFHQDLASWIYICQELRKSEEFNTLTEIAILETSRGLEDPDGLVPFWIIKKIESYRQDILTRFLLTLSRLLELYGGSRRRCHQNPGCDALALGKLIQGLTSTGLYPVPKLSTLNRSILELFSIVRAIDLSSLCGKSTKKLRKGLSYDDEKSSQICHLDEELQTLLSSIEDSFQGLDINERSSQEEFRT